MGRGFLWIRTVGVRCVFKRLACPRREKSYLQNHPQKRFVLKDLVDIGVYSLHRVAFIRHVYLKSALLDFLYKQFSGTVLI